LSRPNYDAINKSSGLDGRARRARSRLRLKTIAEVAKDGRGDEATAMATSRHGSKRGEGDKVSE
jgi:hypothetical protein